MFDFIFSCIIKVLAGETSQGLFHLFPLVGVGGCLCLSQLCGGAP